ncbi:TetR/AcrR family transcriptional regulator [Nocardia sp. NPDC003183]
MPRVSDEHRERRRQQILDAAQLCFARKGFHNSSMQDILTESRMSAGAVYRYFESKEDLIVAVAAQTSNELHTLMTDSIRPDPLPSPVDLMELLAEYIVSHTGATDRGRLAPQAWALALTDPGVGEHVSLALRDIRGFWQEYAERMRDAGWLPKDTDVHAASTAMLGMLTGFMLQHLIIGDVDPRTFADGVRSIFPLSGSRRGELPAD